jgi:hypothetical protein
MSGRFTMWIGLYLGGAGMKLDPSATTEPTISAQISASLSRENME